MIVKAPAETQREFFDRVLREFPVEGMAALHKMAGAEDLEREVANEGPEYHLRQAREKRKEAQEKAPEPRMADVERTFYPSWKDLQTPLPVADVPSRRFGRNRIGVSGKLKDGFLLLHGEE